MDGFIIGTSVQKFLSLQVLMPAEMAVEVTVHMVEPICGNFVRVLSCCISS